MLKYFISFILSETDVHGETGRCSWREADWGAYSKVHWLDPQSNSFKVKQWTVVPASLLWGEHSVYRSNQACELKDWICCRSDVFQEVAEVLEMVDSVGAGLYLYMFYILYIFCICILIHETQNDRPHIYGGNVTARLLLYFYKVGWRNQQKWERKPKTEFAKSKRKLVFESS